MELYESLNPQQILQKITNLGMMSPNQKFVLQQDAIKSATQILYDYISSQQESLIIFMVDSIFAQQQSKSKTYEYCDSLINSLQQLRKQESQVLLYIYGLDQQNISQFYIKCRDYLYQYTKSKHQLDDIYLKFNDILDISRNLFNDKGIDSIIKLLSDELSIDPFMMYSQQQFSINAGQYIFAMIKIFQMIWHHKTFETPIKKVHNKQEFPIFKGFYRWQSPILRRSEFLQNPKNQKMLKELKQYAQKYPKNYDTTQNYLSPLKQDKSHDQEMIRFSSIYSSKSFIKLKAPQKQSRIKTSSSPQLTQEQIIYKHGCVFAEQLKSEELTIFANRYNLIYFDPRINLPKPLNTKITYENLIDLYQELKKDPTFKNQKYRSISFLKSEDPRYLKLTANTIIEAVTQFEGWILAKNDQGLIGCCSLNYLQKL